MLYYNRLNIWNAKSRLKKWIAGVGKPKIEDFNID